MKEEHKQIIENLIQYVKTKDGKIFINDYVNFFGDKSPKIRAVITNLLLNDLLLLRKSGSYFHLTKEGWNFKSFNAILEDEQQQRRQNELQYDNLHFQNKSKYWPHIIALIALAISFIALIIDNNGNDESIEKTKKLELRIRALEAKIDSLKMYKSS